MGFLMFISGGMAGALFTLMCVFICAVDMKDEDMGGDAE